MLEETVLVVLIVVVVHFERRRNRRGFLYCTRVLLSRTGNKYRFKPVFSQTTELWWLGSRLSRQVGSPVPVDMRPVNCEHAYVIVSLSGQRERTKNEHRNDVGRKHLW